MIITDKNKVTQVCEPCDSFSQILKTVVKRKDFVCRYIRNSYMIGGVPALQMFSSFYPVDVIRGYVVVPSVLPYHRRRVPYFGYTVKDNSGYIIIFALV